MEPKITGNDLSLGPHLAPHGACDGGVLLHRACPLFSDRLAPGPDGLPLLDSQHASPLLQRGRGLRHRRDCAPLQAVSGQVREKKYEAREDKEHANEVNKCKPPVFCRGITQRLDICMSQ